MAQRVLITAGASGIGLEIARAFIATGAAVFMHKGVTKRRASLDCGRDPACFLSSCLCHSFCPTAGCRAYHLIS